MIRNGTGQIIVVGHFIWSAQFGGIGKVVHDLCKFQKTGKEIVPEILIGRSSGELISDYRASGITIRDLEFSNGRDFSYKSYKRVKHQIESLDVIHMHTFNPVVALAAIRSGKPILYTIHGNFGFNRKLSTLERVNRHLLRYFLNHHTSYITFNSEFARQQARKFYGIKNIPQQVLENGVLFEESLAGAADEDTINFIRNKKVIGTTSRFVEIKRIDKLISAFTEISMQRSDVVLLLVGDGKLKEAYLERIKEFGVEEKVHFTGFRKNITAYQSLIDICVFPSYNEAFGLVAIETLALGKPTLVFKDGGGMADIIGNIREEDVVRDTDSLVSRILFYLNNKMTNEEINELITFAKTFEMSHMADKLSVLYKSLLT
jgi:glycosyltransferase involved in cell wall biosynthesis